MKKLNGPLDVNFINQTFFPRTNVQKINKGKCYLWAYVAYRLYSNLELWYMGAHAFVRSKVNKKFYDSETPQGVKNWRDLPATNNGKGCGCHACAKPARHIKIPRKFRYNWRGMAKQNKTNWLELHQQIKKIIKENRTMNAEQFIKELSLLRPNSTFLTLQKYKNGFSEIADYSIAFHISYENALKKSIQTLSGLNLTDDLEKQARQELISSFTKSLTKLDSTPMEELEDAYTHFKDDDGKYIKGLKLHTSTNTLHLYGLVVHKRVYMPGMYPKTNKKPLTLAKDKLRHFTQVGKFRQFVLTPDRVDRISVQNLSLLPPE